MTGKKGTPKAAKVRPCYGKFGWKDNRGDCCTPYGCTVSYMCLQDSFSEADE
jgi:hypothetical protein